LNIICNHKNSKTIIDHAKNTNPPLCYRSKGSEPAQQQLDLSWLGLVVADLFAKREEVYMISTKMQAVLIRMHGAIGTPKIYKDLATFQGAYQSILEANPSNSNVS
jgi:hypothetical protein